MWLYCVDLCTITYGVHAMYIVFAIAFVQGRNQHGAKGGSASDKVLAPLVGMAQYIKVSKIRNFSIEIH